jgi:hypothetical protein
MGICDNSTFRIGLQNINRNLFVNYTNPCVLDFFDSLENRFLSLREFNSNTGNQLNFLTHLGIIESIRGVCGKLNFNLALTEHHPLPRQPLIHNIAMKSDKGCRDFYVILRNKEVLNTNKSYVEQKWHEELGFILSVESWDRYRANFSKINFMNNIKWLQFRIFHRVLQTNRIRSKYKPNVVNICDICKAEPETISHLFFRCLPVRHFWNNLNTFSTNIGSALNINEKEILFGDLTTKIDSVENILLMHGKAYIWQCKLYEKQPCIIAFKKYFKIILTNIKYMYMIMNKNDVFDSNWILFHVHLSEQDDGT